jgi:hypothetical protein
MSTSVSLERLARNQVLFREVKERLREQMDESTGETDFLCECRRTDCIETVTLSLFEYECVRSSPNRFLIVPGHEIPEIDSVVAASDGFFIVKKTKGWSTQRRTTRAHVTKSNELELKFAVWADRVTSSTQRACAL